MEVDAPGLAQSAEEKPRGPDPCLQRRRTIRPGPGLASRLAPRGFPARGWLLGRGFPDGELCGRGLDHLLPLVKLVDSGLLDLAAALE